MYNFTSLKFDVERKFSFSELNFSISSSHGCALINDESIDIFVYSSTFYIDFVLDGLSESSAVLLKFNFPGEMFDAVRVDQIIYPQTLREICPIRRPAPLSVYAERSRICIPCGQLASENGSITIRVWFYTDLYEPVIFTISEISSFEYSREVDIFTQMSDLVPLLGARAWRDSLRPLIEAGWTPLHFLAQWGHSELVNRLLTDGCDPDVAEANGGTALHRAADTGNLGIAEILLSAGAAVNAVDGDLLETPFDCALRKGHMRVSESLRLKGGRKYHELQAV